MCSVGPFARASGLDIHRGDPYGAYPDLEFKVITDTNCDILGRVIVRVLELLESCKMIRQMLENLPEGDIVVKKVPRKVPDSFAQATYLVLLS